MRKVQINSVYVNNGMTVVSLFFDEEKNVMYYIIDVIPNGQGTGRVNIEVPEEYRNEMLKCSDKVWGIDPDLYMLRRYISSELLFFLENCWKVIRKSEPKLFPIITE